MEFNDVVNLRKSVRCFSGKKVSEEDIEKIICCGLQAPSACNVKALHFEAVQEPGTKELIVSATYTGSKENDHSPQNWIQSASVIILVLGDIMKYQEKFGEDYFKDLYLNASACIENMLLKVVDMGLGACYVTGFKGEKLKQLLGIHDGMEIIALLPVGYEKHEEGPDAAKNL